MSVFFSLASNASFILSLLVGSKVASTPKIIDLSSLPSKLVHEISGDDKNLLNKISWLAPVSGITVASLATYKFYEISSSPLIKGFTLGVHNTAMGFFCNTAPSREKFITLEHNFESLILDRERFSSLSEEEQSSIEVMAGIVDNIAFTILNSRLLSSPNQILANAVTTPLLLLVKIVIKRIFMEWALQGNQLPIVKDPLKELFNSLKESQVRP